MSTSTASPPHPLPGWLKNTLLATGILALCWGAAIAYWRVAEIAPGTGELALVLLGTPLILLLAFWAGKKRVLGRSAAAAAAAAGSAQAQQAAPAAPPLLPLAILAAALRVPHGDSPEELANAIAGNGARPDLDPELVDDDGFPVTSARSEAAVDEALQAEVREWLILNGMADLHLGDAHWRALTLGTAVARELANEAMLALSSEARPVQLRLLPLLPAGWTVEQRHAVGLWFKHTMAQFGWPPEHLARVDVARDAALALVLNTHDAQAATLVLACDSNIDQETVDAWSSNGTLHGATRSQGRIPGEGAAGLLVASLDMASKIDGALFAQLYAVSDTRREVSLDSARRPETRRMAELAERAAQAARMALPDVTAVLADTDHRSSRTLELMSLVSSALPELDATADVLCSGVALGTCGAVPVIAALALARHAVLAKKTPVLFVSNDDPFTCCMALVGPPPAPVQPA